VCQKNIARIYSIVDTLSFFLDEGELVGWPMLLGFFRNGK
jgi:hypothetical protein